MTILSPESGEAPKSKEVFTDGVEFIGPVDSEETLQAYTALCGVLTMYNKEKRIAGMLHISLGADPGEILGEAVYKARGLGLSLADFEYRRFKGQYPIWENSEAIFEQYGIELPPQEDVPNPGIRINKNTGEITHYA